MIVQVAGIVGRAGGSSWYRFLGSCTEIFRGASPLRIVEARTDVGGRLKY